MPRKRKRNIEDVDHAFELALIIINIISAIFAEIVSTEQTTILPPILENIPRLSMILIFPSILTISAWIIIYFTDNDTWRMRLRTYAWGNVLFLIFFEITEFYVICRPQEYPQWLNFLFLTPFFLSAMIPLIPFFLIRKILNRYETVLKGIQFFDESGMLGKLVKYTPFLLSYITFWIAFFAASSI